MQNVFRVSTGSTKSVDRLRTAMDCITNTHDTARRSRGFDKKRRSSGASRTSQPKERKSLDFPRRSSHRSWSSKIGKDGTVTETVHVSMFRNGYQGVMPDHGGKAGLLQVRRRGYSDSRQFFPLQITVPPTPTLCDSDRQFENPRKAPLPQSSSNNTSQALNTSVSQQPPTASSNVTATPSTIVECPSAEIQDLSQASIFSLPKFNPEKEMRTLQNLWSKRCSHGESPPLICRSPSPSLDIPEVDDPTTERSFFESDSESDDEEPSSKRFFSPLTLIDDSKPWSIGRRNGRGSFSALKRAITGVEKFGAKDLSTNAVPPSDWKKTYSLCDQDGDRLLILETSSENTLPIAGSITGIAFELFRSQDDETKKFIIRSHSLYTNTARILDTIHACLLNNECGLYWQSNDAAAMSVLATLALWQQVQPQEFKSTMRRQKVLDMTRWCADNVDENHKEHSELLQQLITEEPFEDVTWLLTNSTEIIKQDEQRRLISRLKPWELAQYFAIYDFLYMSRMLSEVSLEVLLAPIARDDVSIFASPDLRADQIQYWVTIEILNSRSASCRIRLICLFIETATALLELSDYFTAFLICTALHSPDVQSLIQTWKKIPQEQMSSLRHVLELCQMSQSWTTHQEHLQSKRRSCIPYLPCIIRELRNINATQPTNVKFHDSNLCVDDPVVIPAQQGTGMINIRKFRSIYGLVYEALEIMQSPYSFWYRLFPEDLQFPAPPVIDEGYLAAWAGMRDVVEGAIESCWEGGGIGDGNWERSLHIKKILASAGF